MSWSVTAKGTIAEVKTELERQFSYPLADPGGLTDPGERETVRLISGTISQCLETFDPEKSVSVSANGHISFDNWDTKAGASQNVSMVILPVS